MNFSNKLYIILLFTLFFAFEAAAQPESKSIIGLEYATGSITQNYGTTGIEDNRDLTMTGLKLGAKTDVKRLFLSFRKHTISNTVQESDGKSFSMEYDALGSSDHVAIFAGFIFGYSQDSFYGQDGYKRSQDSFIYGFNAGLAMDFNFVGVDIGLRYTYPLESTNDSVATQTYEIGATATTYLALYYLY